MSVPTHRLELWLDALAGIGEAVGGDEPVTDLLNRVARTACTLLGYDFCAVFLPDEHERALTIVGSHGLSPDYVAQVNAQRPILLAGSDGEEAPTSIAFRTGDVVALEDIESVPGIGPWGGVAHEQGYRALVSVPLRRGSRVVGALNGYHATPHRFGHAEISLVNAMATQVAIALGTAQLRASEQNTIRELRRSEEVHTLLTATALRGEGVSGVASALSELLGRDVLIEDVYGERLAGGFSPPDHDIASTGVVLDGKVVAHIRIDAPPEDLSRLDVRAAEQAAVVTALELLRARTAAEVEQRLRGSLVADLLSADSDADALLDRARRLGWDLSGRQHLLALRCTGSHDRLLAAADRVVSRVSPRPLAAIYRDDLVLVWSPAAGEVAVFAAQLVGALVGGGAVSRAIAAVTGAEPPSRLPGLFRTVRGALDLGGEDAGVIDLRETAIDHLLLQLDDPTALRDFASSTLGAALDYDRENTTELLRTARVLLDHDLDRQSTAAELHLHPNTVAQRVRRLEGLTGLKLSKPRDLLRLTSALSVARIVGLG
ncbi:helix-turn-helix domain-containing protein [Mycobacterium sp. MS1601]|uniref:helix-turn-helix domain-containing protein n=1 Tax=Mycobacterium sp. MS1601 TaxID=1936029 RepID=UPI00178CC50B|nr:GAF domain-containing protein [Mycobacterium sp. MS1601]